MQEEVVLIGLGWNLGQRLPMMQDLGTEEEWVLLLLLLWRLLVFEWVALHLGPLLPRRLVILGLHHKKLSKHISTLDIRSLGCL